MDKKRVRALLIAVLFTNATIAAEVSATRLDGRTVVGDLKSLDDQVAIIKTAEGEQRILLNELLSMRWRSDPTDAASDMAAVLQIELIDGSVLPVREFTSNASRASIALAGRTSGNSESLTLARRQIAAVRLQPLDAPLVEQWNDVRETKSAADVVVVRQDGGKSLDYVEGVLGDVSDEKVAFELDGDALKIDRKKVAGFLYFRRDTAKEAEPRFVLHGRSGLKARIARARIHGNALQFITTGGTKLDWPLGDIHLADFSAGKLVYMSDLDPASQKTRALVALPSGISLAGKYADPRRDHSAFGGPLTLVSGDDLENSSDAGLQTFNKGLAIRSHTELVYRLPPGYRRLSAIAGIDPATTPNGNVHLEILGDDQPLLTADVHGTDPPRPIDLDIAGVKRLKIVVNYGRNLDTGDWLNLCDLRILK